MELSEWGGSQTFRLLCDRAVGYPALELVSVLGRKRTLGRSLDKFGCADFQSLSQLLDNGDCWIARSPLDIADVGSMDPGAVSEVLLAPTILEPEASDVRTEALANIHANQRRRCRQWIYRR